MSSEQQSSVWRLYDDVDPMFVVQLDDEHEGCLMAEMRSEAIVFFAELSDPMIINYPQSDGPYTTLGPGVFTDGNVINHNGQNFYRACDAIVSEVFGGGSSHCVKRAGHSPGSGHEDYAGKIRKVHI